ncbi:MAG: CARDB domain-containing protein, partial [Chloroflexota bacterium]
QVSTCESYYLGDFLAYAVSMPTLLDPKSLDITETYLMKNITLYLLLLIAMIGCSDNPPSMTPNLDNEPPHAIGTDEPTIVGERPDLIVLRIQNDYINLSGELVLHCAPLPNPSPLRLTAIVRNIGTAPAGAFVVRIGETLVAIDGLLPGTSQVVSSDYYSSAAFTAQVDVNDEIDESNEDNNQAQGYILTFTPPSTCTVTPLPDATTVSDALPDLTLWHLGIDDINLTTNHVVRCFQAYERGHVQRSYIVRLSNQSNTPVGPFIVRVIEADYEIPGIPANGSYRLIAPVIPFEGSYYDVNVVEIDPDNQIHESDETNNLSGPLQQRLLYTPVAPCTHTPTATRTAFPPHTPSLTPTPTPSATTTGLPVVNTNK